jgi:hypothetical protein
MSKVPQGLNDGSLAVYCHRYVQKAIRLGGTRPTLPRSGYTE